MSEQRPTGLGIDAAGGPVVDPTENVKQLVIAETRRQDDLREMESAHAREIMDLRARYDDKLREAEAKRIDAIRAVDVAAVNRAAEVSSTVAATLAAQVATTAETLRATLAAALEPIIKDIADLRRAQYEQVGSKAQGTESRAALYAAVGLGITVIFLVLAVTGFALAHVGK